MTQLCLPGPYGWDSSQYVSVALHTENEIDEAKVRQVLRNYSCHEPAIPRILSCLRYSNHYECFLQYSWMHNSHKECTRDLAAVGVQLIIKQWVRYKS